MCHRVPQAPLWAAMCYNTWVYVKARQMLTRLWKLRGKRTGRKRLPLLLYPAVLLICWAAGTVNRLQNWVRASFHPHLPPPGCVTDTVCIVEQRRVCV